MLVLLDLGDVALDLVLHFHDLGGDGRKAGDIGDARLGGELQLGAAGNASDLACELGIPFDLLGELDRELVKL